MEVMEVMPLRDEWLNAANEPKYEPNDVLDSIDSQPWLNLVYCKNCVFYTKDDTIKPYIGYCKKIMMGRDPLDFCSRGLEVNRNG